MITYWDFTDFFYIEHFAILPSERGKGYGARTLDCLKKWLQRPIVLEVEMPDNDTARRRIGFYERQGFVFWDCPYLQPPYRKGDEPLPMRIMVYGGLESAKDFHFVEQSSIVKCIIANNLFFCKIGNFLAHRRCNFAAKKEVNVFLIACIIWVVIGSLRTLTGHGDFE